MVYTPIKTPFSPSPTSATSLMAPGGMNKRDLQLLLGVENAVQITNYLIKGDGKLEKRKGIRSLTDQGGTAGVTMIKEFTSDIIIFGFGTTVAAYAISTDTYTALKTDFTANDGFDGARYGDYFFSVNGEDNLTRFYRQITADISYNTSGTNTLYFASQTSNFTVGQVVTGATSGATATITAQTDIGTSGNLTVTAISGTFQDAEAITDPLGGDGTITEINTIVIGSRITGATSDATAEVLEISSGGNDSQVLVLGRINGIFQNAEVITSDQATTDGIGRAVTSSLVTWNNASVSAPIGSVISAIGNRILIGDIKDDRSAVVYSQADDGTNPPFTSWTEDSTFTNAGRVRYRSAGTVRAITNLGPYYNIYSDKGRFVFFINTLDSNGSIVKKDDFIDSRIDFGGARGAVTTEKGIFFANEGGIQQTISTGQTDVPLSDQTLEITNLLGEDYFDDLDFTNADFVYDQKRRYLFMTAARSSSVNNLVIGYFFDKKALVEFQGLNVNRFLNIDHTLYGAHSNKAQIFTLFDGYDDDGQLITTELYQEIKLGEFYTRQSLEKFYIQGRFSEETSLTIDFDIFDIEGEFVQGVKSYTWTAQILGNQGVGFDEIGYDGAYEMDPETADDGLINAFDGAAPGIKNAKRILVRITGSDGAPHKLSWMTLQGRIKAPIRRRKLSLN